MSFDRSILQSKCRPSLSPESSVNSPPSNRPSSGQHWSDTHRYTFALPALEFHQDGITQHSLTCDWAPWSAWGLWGSSMSGVPVSPVFLMQSVVPWSESTSVGSPSHLLTDTCVASSADYVDQSCCEHFCSSQLTDTILYFPEVNTYKWVTWWVYF